MYWPNELGTFRAKSSVKSESLFWSVSCLDIQYNINTHLLSAKLLVIGTRTM